MKRERVSAEERAAQRVELARLAEEFRRSGEAADAAFDRALATLEKTRAQLDRRGRIPGTLSDTAESPLGKSAPIMP